MLFSLLLFLLSNTLLSVNAFDSRQVSLHSKCRFSPLHSREAILHNYTDFELDLLYWDGRFVQDNVGFILSNGLTSDYAFLNVTTGLAIGNEKQISSPANEAFHLMFLAQAIANDPLAARFLYPDNPTDAAQFAAAVATQKLQKYLEFNHTYPGFAGFLPSFLVDAQELRPAEGWEGRVSAVENGKLVWAVYGLCQVLHQSNIIEFRQLGTSWETWLNYTKINAKGVFYRGDPLGNVCKITTLKQGSYPYTSFQHYQCEDTCYINDPFEGELMTWFLHFSGMLNITQRTAMWEVKKSQLQAVNYTGSVVANSSCHETADYSGKPVSGRHIMPITVQKGLFFGSQESLKLLFLPYLDIPVVKEVFNNAEKVRTCNSWLMSNPGMYASTSDTTMPPNTESGRTVIENAGIPGVAVIQQQRLDVIAPYSTFPTIIMDRAVGLAWLKNMLDAKGVQSPYGSVAGLRRDGTGNSIIVDWSTKAPISLAMLGGIVSLVKAGMEHDGIYDDFVNITAREYGRVFDSSQNGGKKLMGEHVHICLPSVRVPADGIRDYISCQ